MSDTSQGGRPAPQEFEKVLAAATTTVASFDEEHLSFAKRTQHFLHSYPTTVPFVVLVLGLLLGVSVNYTHFVTGSNLSTVLTQVTIIGILGIAQTLVILTAGIDLSVGVIMVIATRWRAADWRRRLSSPGRAAWGRRRRRASWPAR